MNLSYRLDTSVFDKLPELIRKHAAPVIASTAFDIQARAQENAPVDTGALKASIYTATSRSSGSSAALSAAASLYAAGNGGAVPVDPAIGETGDELKAVVAVGVEYGKYVEFGTGRSAPQAFLLPAAQELAGSFREAIAGAVNRAMQEAAK